MNRILVTSLLLNLVLVVAIVVGATFTGFFVQSNVLDPIYERQVSIFDTFSVESGDIVFLGDTLVAAAPVEEMFPGHPVKNRGIVGDTSAGVLARLDQVLAGDPAALVVMVGTFDVLAGTPRRDTTARVEQLLDAAAESNPELPVMLVSVLPRDVEAIQSVARLNEDYQALTEARGHGFLDLAAVVRGADGALHPEFSNDGLHLNGAGYQRWREELGPWLEALGAASPLLESMP